MKSKKKTPFKNLTPAQKAVAIATDAILQINQRVYQVTSGTYTSLDVSAHVGCELQGVIKKEVTKQNPCQVCAIGSAFLSGVRLFDQFKIKRPADRYEDTIKPGPMRTLLAKFFHKEDIWALEICFEGDPHFVHYQGPLIEEWDASEVFHNFLDVLATEERLVWLLQVIIDNDGRFTIDLAKRAALITLGTSKEPRWVEFRRLHAIFV